MMAQEEFNVLFGQPALIPLSGVDAWCDFCDGHTNTLESVG